MVNESMEFIILNVSNSRVGYVFIVFYLRVNIWVSFGVWDWLVGFLGDIGSVRTGFSSFWEEKLRF